MHVGPCTPQEACVNSLFAAAGGSSWTWTGGAPLQQETPAFFPRTSSESRVSLVASSLRLKPPPHTHTTHPPPHHHR